MYSIRGFLFHKSKTTACMIVVSSSTTVSLFSSYHPLNSSQQILLHRQQLPVGCHHGLQVGQQFLTLGGGGEIVLLELRDALQHLHVVHLGEFEADRRIDLRGGSLQHGADLVEVHTAVAVGHVKHDQHFEFFF